MTITAEMELTEISSTSKTTNTESNTIALSQSAASEVNEASDSVEQDGAERELVNQLLEENNSLRQQLEDLRLSLSLQGQGVNQNSNTQFSHTAPSTAQATAAPHAAQKYVCCGSC